MTEGFIVATVFVGYLAILCFVVFYGLDNDWNGWAVTAFATVWLTLGFGFLFGMMIEEEASGPCLAYETQMYYNAGTKTMIPARVCVNRAEWVQQ